MNYIFSLQSTMVAGGVLAVSHPPTQPQQQQSLLVLLVVLMRSADDGGVANPSSAAATALREDTSNSGPWQSCKGCLERYCCEMDMLNYYQKNIDKLKIQESSIRGIAFDESGRFLASSSDFGHLTLYDLSELDSDGQKPVPSRTFNHKRSPYYCIASTSKSLFCGGENCVTAWSWSDLVENKPLEAHVPIDMQCGTRTDIQCLATNTAGTRLYGAGGNGVIHSFDLETGKRLSAKPGHRACVHSLKYSASDQASPLILSCDESGVVLLWDERVSSSNSSSTVGRFDCLRAIRQAGVATIDDIVWAGAMDVDLDGNFLYIGGGLERQCGKKRNATVTNTKTPQTGWLACAHVGVGGARCANGHDDSGVMLVNSTSTQCAIQEVQVRGSDLLTGGPEAVLRQWHTATLELVTSMSVSTPSVYCISQSPMNSEVLAIGGEYPVVDVVAVSGHIAVKLHPEL